MDEHLPRALFVGRDGAMLPDSAVCGATLTATGVVQPCLFSDHGRLPQTAQLTVDDVQHIADRGQVGDYCPPCAKQQLGALDHWSGHAGQQFPPELLPLRLFKCRQWAWLVVPGLRDDAPQLLGDAETETQ